MCAHQSDRIYSNTKEEKQRLNETKKKKKRLHFQKKIFKIEILCAASANCLKCEKKKKNSGINWKQMEH